MMSQHPTIDAPVRVSTPRSRGAALYAPARQALEALFAVAFVIAVYEALVAGEIHLWPNAPDSWILPVWVLAASLSGLGLGPADQGDIGGDIGRAIAGRLAEGEAFRLQPEPRRGRHGIF